MQKETELKRLQQLRKQIIQADMMANNKQQLEEHKARQILIKQSDLELA
jgi:hypothetical protein